MQIRSPHWQWILVVLLSLAAPAQPQGSHGRFIPSRNVVRPADTDLDGQITPVEWKAYLAQLAPSDSLEVDATRLRARIFVPMFDQTADAQLTIEDVLILFESLDGNLDQVIGVAEFPSNEGSASRGAAHAGGTPSMATVIAGAADVNGDGRVDEDERGMFVDGLEYDPSDELGAAMVVRWIDQAIEAIPQGRARFAPGATLRWIKDNIDANQDGALDVEDLAIFFEDLDKDSDGTVTAQELELNFGSRGGSNADPASVPLMPWQRSLGDAMALVRATGKPLLICVNTEGEFASDSLANRRYRDPAFVELARGFIPLIVSPGRRNPRDHDDRGRRIADARFGRVTDAERIGIESELYERYFGGQRVAPRHVGVDANGKVLFDIFLVNDLSVVDAALREHGKRAAQPLDPANMTEEACLASPDALHRAYLEQLFCAGDARLRTRLASLALSSARATQHPEILRLALADPEAVVRTQAVWTVARHAELASLEAVRTALRVCAQDSAESTALLMGLRLVVDAGPHANRERWRSARNLLHAHEGLRSSSPVVDLDGWRVALGWSDPVGAREPASVDDLSTRLAELGDRLAERPERLDWQLAVAATTLRLAELRLRSGDAPTFLLDDTLSSARRVARVAEDQPDARALAFAARASFLLMDMDAAANYAAAAVQHGIPWAGSRAAALALEVLLETRVRAVLGAIERDDFWPSVWVADAVAAGSLLLEHSLGDERAAVTLLRFLRAIDVGGLRPDLMRAALRRFPESGSLHKFYRTQILMDGGARALQRAYLDIDAGSTQATQWFDALAQLMAAERHAKNHHAKEALATYMVSIDRFRSSQVERADYADSASHYICLALAGAARLQTGAKDWAAARANLLAAVASNPRSVWEQDGLGNTPRDTAQRLHTALTTAGLADQAHELRSALASQGLKLDP